MKVLVTGATGVLGRRVVPRLVADGHTVTAVARDRAAQLSAAGARPVALDLFDPATVEEVVADQDAVLDLATRIPPTSRMALPWAWRDNDRLRRDAAATVAGAAARHRLHYVRESIGLLYADAGEAWVDEAAPSDPLPHTATALDAEAAARSVTEAGGVGVALRFATFYGPDSHHTRDVLDAARRGWAGVVGPPDGFTSQVHLDDAASAVVAALHAPAGTWNVVEDEPLRRHEQVELLAAVVGRPVRPLPTLLGRVGATRALARSLRLSNRAFREATGWAPRYTSPRQGWPDVAAEIDREVAA